MAALRRLPRLLPLLRPAAGPALGPGPRRALRGAAAVPPARVDRFGGVHVDLAELRGRRAPGAAAFGRWLRGAVERWREQGRVAVWLHVPVPQSGLVAAAAAHGFALHHAEAGGCTLALWLAQGPSRLPPYATHQVGVAGAVLDESTGKVLVVQDRNRTVNAWKFPGGLSNPDEDIGDTAVREVFEETGIRSEFRSILSVRQQHRHPGAFGKSDMYFICRLQPCSFSISLCEQECLSCAWMELAELATTKQATPITSSVAKLLLYGHREGFHKIDLSMRELPAARTGLFYKLYHRELPEAYRDVTG